MPNLVLFLEEASAKELLRQLLPRMFPESDILFIYKVYEGKNDLQQNIRSIAFDKIFNGDVID